MLRELSFRLETFAADPASAVLVGERSIETHLKVQTVISSIKEQVCRVKMSLKAGKLQAESTTIREIINASFDLRNRCETCCLPNLIDVRHALCVTADL